MYRYKGIDAVGKRDYEEFYINVKKINDMTETLLKLTKLLNQAIKEEANKEGERRLETKI